MEPLFNQVFLAIELFGNKVLNENLFIKKKSLSCDSYNEKIAKQIFNYCICFIYRIFFILLSEIDDEYFLEIKKLCILSNEYIKTKKVPEHFKVNNYLFNRIINIFSFLEESGKLPKVKELKFDFNFSLKK
ncbi:MAG: hypothetical protein QW818_02535 [Candidatus Aenigmatarchaeota archaeon]